MPPDDDWDSYEARGLALAARTERDAWAFGAWWAAGKAWSRQRTALVASDQWPRTAPALKALRNYCVVYRKFPKPSSREDGLSLGHHAAAARLEQPDQRAAFLAQAKAEGWSVRETEREVSRLRGERLDWSHLKENFSLQDLIDSGRRFRTIYADPPWEYESPLYARIERHYPTMPTDEICALPIGNLAEPNAMLHMWVPPALIPHALRVIEAWGFVYQTNLTWVKVIGGRAGRGTGNWWRTGHEHLLLAMRGRPGMFFDHGHSSVFNAPRGKHSAKPPEIRALLQEVCAGPYLELFAREQVDGWTSWGNQVEASAEAAD